MRNSSIAKVIAVCAAIPALIFALRALNPGTGEKSDPTAGSVAAANASAEDPMAKRSASAPSSTAPAGEDKTVFLKEAEPTPVGPTPTPEPADQGRESRRAYLKTSFINNPALSSFKLEGLEVTPDGIKLKDVPAVDGVRKGILESPPLPLEHASNMVAPIWHATNPDGSSTLVEMQVVEGGKASPWYAVELNDEHISPTYPDGSPNPNYGANVGSPLGFGLELYGNVRYRMTVSATGESPLIRQMNVYHADSTDGEGFPANDPPPERAILEAAANAGN